MSEGPMVAVTADGDVAATCPSCGAWFILERDKDGCANCRVIAQRTEERRGATRAIIVALVDAHRFQGMVEHTEALLKLADALDHYIARSSQGWCR